MVLKKRWPIVIWIAIWLVIWVAISALVSKGDDRTVTTAYRSAALNWVDGDDMYAKANKLGHGFLYLPHAAIVYVPFAVSPEPWGDILWRGLALFTFALGVVRLTKLLESESVVVLGTVATVATIMSISCLRIGQSTLPMAGLMMLSVEAMHRRSWSSSTMWLILAVILKPLAIVLVLLAGVLQPHMRLRLLLGLAIAIPLPFAFQGWSYVAWQFQECGKMLLFAAELGNQTWWAQLFGMLKVFGFEVPGLLQTVTRVLAAFLTLALCWNGFVKLPSKRAHLWLYSYSVVFLMLFNPRTENSTYCLLGPVLGCFLAEEFLNKRAYYAAGLIVLVVCVTGSYEIGKFFTPANAKPVWLAPLACLIFSVYLLHKFFNEVKDYSVESCRTSPGLATSPI